MEILTVENLLKLTKENLIHIAIYSTLIVSVLISFILKRYGKNLFINLFHKDIEVTTEYNKSIDNDAIIYSKLGILLEYYKAGRVWFGRLHNGIYFSNGESFKKYSINHMVVNKGIAWPAWYPRSYQDVPLSIAHEFMSPLFHKKIVNMQIKEFPDRGYFKKMLQMDDTEEITCILIENNSKPVGFIGVSWTKHKPSKGKGKDWMKLVDEASDLGLILSEKPKRRFFSIFKKD